MPVYGFTTSNPGSEGDGGGEADGGVCDDTRCARARRITALAGAGTALAGASVVALAMVVGFAEQRSAHSARFGVWFFLC